MGKGGRLKTEMRYVCRPKKNVAGRCFAPTCDTIFPSSITPNCDMFSTFYPSCGDMGVGQPTPCPRMMSLNVNYNTYVKHDMGLKIFLEGYPMILVSFFFSHQAISIGI